MKSIKLLITGIFLIIIGGLVCGASVIMMGFNFGSLNTATYVSNTYDMDPEFENISIKGDAEKISFAPSDGGKCYVVCKELENDKHDVRVVGDTLCIDNISDNMFFFVFLNDSPEMTVYLPEDKYSSLSIDNDTGDVYIPEDFSFSDMNVKLDTGALVCSASATGDVNVKTDTGKINLQEMTPASLTVNTDTGFISLNDINCSGTAEINVHTARVEMNNVNCAEFNSKGSTGRLLMTNVVTTGSWNIKRETGSVSFEYCDAALINITTATGNVAGSLLSGKMFNVNTDTGKVNVPGSSEGGKCDIVSDTGNIDITINR